MDWAYHATTDGAELTVHSDSSPKSARLFRVAAPTQDFRDSKWTSEEITDSKSSQNGATYKTSFANPASGYAAVFAEVSYEIDGKPFTLSTQIDILAAPKGAKQ